MKQKWINYNELKNNIVYVSNSDNYYADKNGNIYKRKNNKLLKKKLYLNNKNGYIYCGLKINGKYQSYRVQRIIAQTFLENPNNFNIVGHKDNNKSNNNIENLYWTNISENTKKAYDDGLAKNLKGIEDGQSKPVNMYINNQFIKTYGSLKECSRETKIPIQTVIRRCENEVKNFRKYKEYNFKYNVTIKTPND